MPSGAVFFLRSRRSSNSEYMMGTMTSEIRVELVSPPMTARAIGA